MPETTLNAHDALLYPGRSYAQTHPDRLATLASLFGMNPAPVERCRVLELGCGHGGNLLPMAYALPESAFVGIDLAARAIALGREAAEALDVHNVTFLQQDLMDVSAGFGSFDYIIAHGVYTWVPPVVRDKVLAICRAHLAPHGVAYVSYMTYPGGYVPQMIREMMLFHMRQFKGLKEQITQARAMLKFILEAQQEDTSQYRMLLEKAVARINTYPDEYLIHDDLADAYAPCYFYQFAERAARHGLQYLAEADFFEMQAARFPASITEALHTLGDDVLLREQYLDFLKGRQFRRTLLCHQGVRLEGDIKPERVQGFYVAAPARRAPPAPGEEAAAMERFEGTPGSFAETDEALFKAAIRLLGERWPRQVAFETLREEARTRAGEQDVQQPPREDDAHRLGEMLLALYATNFLELHVHPARFVPEVSERPVASPVARMQIQTGPYVTSLTHVSVRVNDALAHVLLPLLDGTRDQAALLGELVARVEAGQLTVKNEGVPVTDKREIARVLRGTLEESLAGLARQRLLVA